MARKSQISNNLSHDWYLREWMKTLGVTQAKLSRATGWSKATTNDIVHGRTHYYRQILHEAALALNIAPFELLLPPREAMEIRGFRSAVRIAAEQRTEYREEPQSIKAVVGGH